MKSPRKKESHFAESQGRAPLEIVVLLPNEREISGLLAEQIYSKAILVVTSPT
jgi:hypothetical protein